MILFCGIPSEGPLALAIEAAEARGVPHVVLNQRESRGVQLTVSGGPEGTAGTLTVRGERYDLAAFTGVYSRLLHPAQLPEHRRRSATLADPAGARRAAMTAELLESWMQVARCRVANRPRAMLSNASKPYQAQLIARAGFPVPPTLVTNDAASLAPFERTHGRLIFKSVSGERSIVDELRDATRDRLRHLRSLPTQFQARIGGEDIRVHVVGSRVFATRIETGATDYRYARQQGSEAALYPCALPAAVEAKCLAVSRALDLPFCGIDLRRTPEGQYYCFEANPSPAYSYYQEGAGQPIADALVGWLAGDQSS